MSEKTYRIGEAATKLHLKTYVLRFWEMEFNQIAPLRTEKGQRLYTERDIALLRRIRYLLHERGLTIEGARRVLREEAARGVEYHDTEFALPGEGGQPLADDDLPDDKDDEKNDEDAENDEESLPPPTAKEAPHPAQASSSLPVPASLFPPPEQAGTTLPPADAARLAAELMTIHRLLTAGPFGDMP